MTDKTTATSETVDDAAAIGSRVEAVVRPGYGVKKIHGLLCWACAGKVLQCRSKRSLRIWCSRCGERVEGTGVPDEIVLQDWHRAQRRFGYPAYDVPWTNG